MAAKRKRKPKHDLAQLERDHSALRPQLNQLHDELLHQLTQLLGQESIALSFPVQHRVKTWSSVAEKLQRVPLTLSNLRGMQDLVGFRIILQFRRDVERVCSLIEKHLRIVDRYDTVQRLKEDQFGYASIHFVVEVPASWLAVPTMAGLAGLRAEVQVRTTAQHIWAEASRTLQYKSKDAVPATLKRSIYRVSALLETVDLEFERVLSDRDRYKADVAQTTPTTEKLNVDTLERVLDALWPAENKYAGNEVYSDLLSDITELSIETGDNLRKIVSKWREATLAEEVERVNEIRNDPQKANTYKTTPERIAAGVFYTHCGLTRVAISKEMPDRWKQHTHKKWAVGKE